MKKSFLSVVIVFLLCNSVFSIQKIHFSVDDVISSFENLTKNVSKYKSAFDEPFFKYIKSLHDDFGVKISLYCFYEKEGFSLADCTDKFSEDFSSASDWLNFGFHALNSGCKLNGGGIVCLLSRLKE